MLHLTHLVFLACAASLCRCATVLENGVPILWDQTRNTKELLNDDNTITPNVFNYLDRMSLARAMITETNEYMASMGPSEKDNPLWAFALRLGWLLTSGRFADPTDATTCGKPTGDTMCISPDSWWGCLNYFFSVIPFLSAAKKGHLGEGVKVKLLVPDGLAGYCTTHAECETLYPNVIAGWDAFFQGLTLAYSTLPDNVKKDTMLAAFWEAQMASLEATSACDAKKSHYSSHEMSFAKSWMNLFDYLAAVYFQSGQEVTAKFMAPLPSRVLLEQDQGYKIPDLSDEENHTLYIFSWINTMNSMIFGGLGSVWKGAMCSPEVRQTGRDLMEQLVLNSTFPPTTFVSMVAGMSRGC